MKTVFKLAIIQIRTELDQQETIRKAEHMIREAAANGADFVVLPEMWNCPYSGRYFHECAALGHESTVAAMSAWAKELGIYIIGGSICEHEKIEDRTYNTCFVFNPKGDIIAKHRKLHLFDVDIPSMRILESRNFGPGNEVTLFDTEYGKMGVAVCFDIRFPELFRAMSERGAKVVFVPAQFNNVTGPGHWLPYLAIRASDGQMFVVGAGAALYEGFNYKAYGHSAVSDPDGRILVVGDEKEEILYAEIDTALVDDIRAKIPVISSLRRDLYTVTE